MTLIISAASWLGAIQVEDCLITLGGKEYDPYASKNILYFAPDGVISFGYTGPAYHDGIPTDQWLAEKITGVKLAPRNRTIRFFGVGYRLANWRPLNVALRVIAEELTAAFPRLKRETRKVCFELLGAGWQLDRRRPPIPVQVSITRDAGAAQVRTRRLPRHFEKNKWSIAVTPDANARQLRYQEFKRQGGSMRTSKDAEQLFVNLIRDVAARNPTVGRDCISIVLSHPRHHSVSVRFIPVQQPQLLIDAPHLPVKQYVLPVAFSPWIVGSNYAFAPSIISGAFTARMHGWDVRFDAPSRSPGRGIRAILDGAERRPEPR
jgi:hypothetical protein